MQPKIRSARLVAVFGAALFICAGPAHADVVIDLGRGPVTVHVPPIYDPSLPAPLVVLLHGYSSNGMRGERQPLVGGTARRVGGGGVRPPAGSDETPRAQRASHHAEGSG